MTDEPSTSFRLSTTVVGAASLAAVSLSLLIYALICLGGVNNKISVVATDAGRTILGDVTRKESVPAPVAYSALESGIGSIEEVWMDDGVSVSYKLYDFNDINCQNLIKLITKYNKSNVNVRLEQNGANGFVKVYLEVIE